MHYSYMQNYFRISCRICNTLTFNNNIAVIGDRTIKSNLCNTCSDRGGSLSVNVDDNEQPKI